MCRFSGGAALPACPELRATVFAPDGASQRGRSRAMAQARRWGHQRHLWRPDFWARPPRPADWLDRVSAVSKKEQSRWELTLLPSQPFGEDG